MDLGAFLRPGGIFPALLALTTKAPDDAVGSPSVEGRLIERRGQPHWLSPVQMPIDGELLITVKLPGYNLAADGSLDLAGGETGATVILLARVRGCRFSPAHRQYILRLLLLGRICPD